jgi:hypothetical protein
VVDGRYTYTANTGSGSLTGFGIDRRGVPTPLTADGRTATAGDSVVTADGNYSTSETVATTPSACSPSVPMARSTTSGS